MPPTKPNVAPPCKKRQLTSILGLCCWKAFCFLEIIVQQHLVKFSPSPPRTNQVWVLRYFDKLNSTSPQDVKDSAIEISTGTLALTRNGRPGPSNIMLTAPKAKEAATETCSDRMKLLQSVSFQSFSKYYLEFPQDWLGWFSRICKQRWRGLQQSQAESVSQVPWRWTFFTKHHP